MKRAVAPLVRWEGGWVVGRGCYGYPCRPFLNSPLPKRTLQTLRPHRPRRDCEGKGGREAEGVISASRSNTLTPPPTSRAALYPNSHRAEEVDETRPSQPLATPPPHTPSIPNSHRAEEVEAKALSNP